MTLVVASPGGEWIARFVTVYFDDGAYEYGLRNFEAVQAILGPIPFNERVTISKWPDGRL